VLPMPPRDIEISALMAAADNSTSSSSNSSRKPMRDT